MSTIIKIDTRSNEAKRLITFLKTLSYVQIVEEQTIVEQIVEETKPHYNSEFVKKIKESQKQIKKGKFTEVDPDDVWGSLGL